MPSALFPMSNATMGDGNLYMYYHATDEALEIALGLVSNPFLYERLRLVP